MTRAVNVYYRNRKHHGEGMWLRSPAQMQAEFDKSGGVRRFPKPGELDLLLWFRKRLRARGDKVSIQYNHRTLVFRAAQLVALTGECEVEVHVDPINVDRAVAIPLAGDRRAITLEPCMPTGQKTAAELKFEIERQASIRKQVRRAALAGSRLARVRGPEEALALAEAQTASKAHNLHADSGPGRREEISMAPYVGVDALLEELRAQAAVDSQQSTVKTVDPKYLDQAEEFFK
jgi:hypothetical protein